MLSIILLSTFAVDFCCRQGVFQLWTVLTKLTACGRLGILADGGCAAKSSEHGTLRNGVLNMTQSGLTVADGMIVSM
ncbi:MAG: hypothetical protein KC585_04205, partial [Candidatus Magasanikbacteria bacterium]|nr:hypothetical protein [Candidatus Magasanikbacteria bacterium]